MLDGRPGLSGSMGLGETPDRSRQVLAAAFEDWVQMEIDAGRFVPVLRGLRLDTVR